MMQELMGRSQESPKASDKKAPTLPLVAESSGEFGETKIENEEPEVVR